MKYIRTMTQQKLSFWLALYIGWFMNVAVFFRRFDGYAQEFTFWKGLSGVVELVATVFVTFFLLRLLSLFGRRIWRILATLIVLFSSAASYYMTFLNVVIGYGIIASVMTTEYHNGQAIKERASFRSYDSLAQSFDAGRQNKD